MFGLVINMEYRGSVTFEVLLGVVIGGLIYMFFILKLCVFIKKELGIVMK